MPARRTRADVFRTRLRSAEPDRNPTRPYVLAGPHGTTMVWKEFDGEKTTVNVMTSHDDGMSWSKPVAIATHDGHVRSPAVGQRRPKTFLSWMTKADGYRFQPIETKP